MRNWIWAIIASACGCSQPDTSDLFGAEKTVVMDQVVITTADGQTFRGPPVTIEIVAPLPNGPVAKASVAISTVDQNGMGLGLALDIAPSALFGPAMAITHADDARKATLALSSTTGVEIIRSRQVTLTMDHGTLDGFFETDHPRLSAGTIRGTFDVECLVPPEMLGQTFRGPTSAGTWLLVADETHQSSFCRTFAGL